LIGLHRKVWIACTSLTALYGFIIVWLYVHQPQSLSELKVQASVQANVYHVNEPNFDEAIKEFDSGDYNSAIGQFKLADPAQKDPASQYYVAYSYYLLGRGRIFNDEDMFNKAIEAVNRCLDNAPDHIFQLDRADLEIKNADTLRQKLVEGLKHTLPSLNPLNWFNKK
jgi:tetratricopeptide (TPR) repeat protein